MILQNHSKDSGTLTKQDVHIDFMIHITLGVAAVFQIANAGDVLAYNPSTKHPFSKERLVLGRYSHLPTINC